MNKKKRGFASMTPEQRKRIAALGGQAVAQKAGHMSTIGTKGGQTTSQDRTHMSRIGRLGGLK